MRSAISISIVTLIALVTSSGVAQAQAPVSVIITSPKANAKVASGATLKVTFTAQMTTTGAANVISSVSIQNTTLGTPAVVTNDNNAFNISSAGPTSHTITANLPGVRVGDTLAIEASVFNPIFMTVTSSTIIVTVK